MNQEIIKLIKKFKEKNIKVWYTASEHYCPSTGKIVESHFFERLREDNTIEDHETTDIKGAISMLYTTLATYQLDEKLNK